MHAPLIQEEFYSSPIRRVWQALTVEGAMRDWYFPQLISFKPEVGSDFVFSNDGSPYQKQWRVSRVEQGRLLAHSWVYKGFSGESEVVFELFEAGKETRLKLSHFGLESFPDNPHFKRERFENGWEQILGVSLRNYLSKHTTL